MHLAHSIITPNPHSPVSPKQQETTVIPSVHCKPWPSHIVPASPAEQTALRAIFQPQALTVLNRIESVEFSWRMDNVPFPPSFGRESPDEPVLPWSVPRVTGWMLYSLIMASRPQTIIELGTSLGYSTLWLCAAAERTGAHIHTVELMPEKACEARRNLTDAGFANWTLLERDAEDVCRDWNLALDFLFLDADASSYPGYWNRLLPHLSERATLVADNALTHPHLLEPFAEQVSRHQGFLCFTHPMDNGLFIATRIPVAPKTEQEPT